MQSSVLAEIESEMDLISEHKIQVLNNTKQINLIADWVKGGYSPTKWYDNKRPRRARDQTPV